MMDGKEFIWDLMDYLKEHESVNHMLSDGENMTIWLNSGDVIEVKLRDNEGHI